MRSAGRRLLGLAAVLALLGAGLVVLALAREHAAAFPPGNVDGGCYFDQSCDAVPGVLDGRRLRSVGWTVVGAALVVAGLALSAARVRWSRWVWPAAVGLALAVGGAAAKAEVLRGYVPPPTFGCAVLGTCAADPSWAAGDPAYDVVLVLPVLGCALLAVALVLALRRTDLPAG